MCECECVSVHKSCVCEHVAMCVSAVSVCESEECVNMCLSCV